MKRLTLKTFAMLMILNPFANASDKPGPHHGWEYVKLEWSAGEIPPEECDHGTFVMDYTGNFTDTRCDKVSTGVVSPEDMTVFRDQVAPVYKDINRKLKRVDEVVEDYYPTFSMKVPGQKEKIVYRYGGEPTQRRSSAENSDRFEEAINYIRTKYVYGDIPDECDRPTCAP